MGLVDTLGSGFSFSLSGLSTVLDDVDPSAPDVPIAGAEGIVGSLQSFSTDGLLASLAQVAQQGRDGLGDLANPLSIATSLTSELARFDELTESEPLQLFSRLESQWVDAEEGQSLQRVTSVLGGASSLTSDPTISAVVRLASSLSGGAIDLPAGLSQALGGGAAIGQLANSLFHLMSVATQGERIARFGSQLAELLPETEVTSLAPRLAAWGDVSLLVARIRDANPNDPQTVAELRAEVLPFVLDLREFSNLASRGLGFGEAALAEGTLARSAEALLSSLRSLHDFQDMSSLRGFCEQLSQSIEARLPGSLDVTTRFDELKVTIDGLIGSIATAIDELDTSALTQPVSGALGQVTSTVQSVNDAIDSVESNLRAALTGVRDLVRGLNLEAVAEAVRTAIQPIADVIDQLDALLSESLGVIQQAMEDAVEAITFAKNAVLGTADTLKEPFDAIALVLTDLNLPERVATVQSVIDQVVDALRQIRLDPYFDTAIDVMETTAQVIDAVPLDLLPDDMERDLENAVRPIKQIDFANDVRIPLREQLDTILEQIDTDVLGTIQQKYEELLQFLTNIDPRGQIEQLEAETFDAMLERLNGIDPDALLAPIHELLDQVKALVAEVDLRASVLDEVDGVFDEILAHVEQWNPTVLLEPVATALNDAREQVLELTKIESWADGLDDIVVQLEAALSRMDLDQWVALLEAQLPALITSLRGSRQASPLGFLVTATVGGSTASPSAFQEVQRWLASDSFSAGAEHLGVEQLRAQLEQGRERLQATRDRVTALDPVAVTSAAARGWRAMRDAAGEVAGTPLGDALLQVLESNDPQVVLASAVAYTTRYQTAIERELDTLDGLVAMGLSEIDAVAAALRDALRPLDRVKQKVLGLVRQGGIDPLGKPPLDVVAEIFAVIRPLDLVRSLQPLVESLKNKVLELVRDGLIAPAKATVEELLEFIQQLDLSPLLDALGEVFDEAKADVEAFRPSALLAEPLDAFEELQTTVAEYDPLAPVREVITEFQAAVTEVAGPDSPLRPSALLRPVLDAYEGILEDASAIDIQRLLEPVLAELSVLTQSLDQNLERSEGAFKQLQESLP